MEKKFNLTIKNLETGETLVDDNTNAIVCTYNADGKSGSILFTSCDTVDLIEVLVTAEKLIKQAYTDKPNVLLARLFLEKKRLKWKPKKGAKLNEYNSNSCCDYLLYPCCAFCSFKNRQ